MAPAVAASGFPVIATQCRPCNTGFAVRDVTVGNFFSRVIGPVVAVSDLSVAVEPVLSAARICPVGATALTNNRPNIIFKLISIAAVRPESATLLRFFDAVAQVTKHHGLKKITGEKRLGIFGRQRR